MSENSPAVPGQYHLREQVGRVFNRHVGRLTHSLTRVVLTVSPRCEWNLRIMKRDGRTILRTLARCLKLQCPVCGRASVVQRPYNVKHQCGVCGAIFKREEGFFVGAIMANVVATEVFILITYFACLLLTKFGDQWILTILFAIAVGFPLVFYHHAWALWVGIDHLIEGLPIAKAKLAS